MRPRSLISSRLGRVLPALLLGVVTCSFASCQKAPDPIVYEKEPDKDPWTGSPIFEDVTRQAGIEHTFRNGEESLHYSIVESLGGGAALIDYDGDGLLDIFLTGGGCYNKSKDEYKKDKSKPPSLLGCPCKLYKNLGNFKFKDVTREAGLDRPVFFSHGGSVCDYDKDGWPDLLVTGYGGLTLYKNVTGPNGTRTFIDVTDKAGLKGPHFWGTSAGWADFDGDGHPDVYVCQYVDWSWQNHPFCGGYSAKFKHDICPPKQFKAQPHRLYRNNGRGGFVDVTREAGIRVSHLHEAPALETTLKMLEEKLSKWTATASPAEKEKLQRDINQTKEKLDEVKSEEFGKGLGVVVVDVNGDGKPDIYVANDTVDNFLYVNRSRPGQMRFEEVGMAVGVAKDDQGVPQGSMGLDAGDPYGSGLPALWVTNYEGELHALYRNDFRNGHLSFQFNTAPAGIAAIGQLFVGFGTGFLDLNNDGWEDIFISNGHVIRHPYPATLRQRPVMFLNVGDGKFKETKAGGSYFADGHRGRGVAIGDLDNDGRPDVVISHVEEPVTVLRNVADTGNHWLGVNLATPDRGLPVGAKLILEVNGRKLTRFAKGGGSYLSARDVRHLFGLGKATKSGKLTVEWPTGTPRRESWSDLACDRYHTLVQGSGKQ